jgi:hypothetical protein
MTMDTGHDLFMTKPCEDELMLAFESHVLEVFANGATPVTRDRTIPRFDEAGHASVLAA